MPEKEKHDATLIQTTSPHQSIYDQLISSLNISSSGGPVHFEILLESHPLLQGVHVLLDGDSIGIPKKNLRKAYLVARRIFFSSIDQSCQAYQTILDSSAVLLLYEPEHITAANARKRILLAVEDMKVPGFAEAMAKEFWLLDSLFQSPLNRHTKSPTLWSHRRWLMEKSSRPNANKLSSEITQVVLSAAQVHSRNYYAWDYCRWWTDRYPELLHSLNLDQSVHSNARPRMVDFIQDWCLKHPSDTSGWSFLLWLLTSKYDDPQLSKAVVQHVLSTAQSLKLRNESLWFYLRSMMDSTHITQDIQQMYLAEIEAIAQSIFERPKSRSLAETILSSVSKCGANGDAMPDDGS